MIVLRNQSAMISQRSQPQPLPSHIARDLTEGGTQAQIELDGQVYTLRITRAGKLILTK
ncbi:hemin uptake protein HemP [Seohaeicola saemankumensis]|nr:hemin uptake protein HemP [Seohaeicola saemankumensis]